MQCVDIIILMRFRRTYPHAPIFVLSNPSSYGRAGSPYIHPRQQSTNDSHADPSLWSCPQANTALGTHVAPCTASRQCCPRLEGDCLSRSSCKCVDSPDIADWARATSETPPTRFVDPSLITSASGSPEPSPVKSYLFSSFSSLYWRNQAIEWSFKLAC